MFHYTKDDLLKIKLFRCNYRAMYANQRFSDKISCNDVLNTLKRFEFRCAYCADKLNCNHWQLDHFFAKAMGGRNKINNLAPTCKWCNTMKNALDGNAFIEKCKKIVDKNLIEHELGFNGDLDKAGLWKFQAYVEIGGLKGYGGISTIFIENPL